MAQSKARIRRRVKQYKRKREIDNVVAKAARMVQSVIVRHKVMAKVRQLIEQAI